LSPTDFYFVAIVRVRVCAFLYKFYSQATQTFALQQLYINRTYILFVSHV